MMTARIELKEFDSPAAEKATADAVRALKGISDFTLVKGTVHVVYDPLVTSEEKIEQAIAGSGQKVEAAAIEREIPHADLP